MVFSEIIKTEKDKGKEKHVPRITVDKGHIGRQDMVRVSVGRDLEHPSWVEHYIVWIELYGVKKDNDQVVNLGRAACAPVYSNPNVRFHVNQIKDFKSFHALVYCNVHGLWANTLKR